MERIYKKSTREFYTLIILILLSITTIILDYKYDKVSYVRSLVNDLIVYPIHNISMLPKSFFSSFMTEHKDVEMLEIKQGPYNLIKDKIKFENVDDNKIKITK